MSDTQLQFALKAQKQVDVEKAINEMKGSALARSNWEQLIASAPIALQCLGACFMAANAKGTKDIKVPKIPGATLDRPEDLTSNLVRCSNLGTDAFLAANKGMTEIYQLSGMSENKVYDIVDLLGDRASAAKQLPSALRMLQDNASDCYDASKVIDATFAEWLIFTQELWEACQSRSSKVAGEKELAITNKAVAAQRVKDTSTQIETTKKSMEELGKSVDAARRAFTKASESQPTGWDLIGQELVKGLGDTLINGVNAAMTKFAGTNNNQNNNASNGQYRRYEDNNGSSKGSTGPLPDQTYAYVAKDMLNYNMLKSMVKNATGEVDWELASGASKGATGGAGIAYVESMLTLSKNDFANQKGGGLATSTYNKVLDDAIKVAQELKEALKTSAEDLNAQRPTKGSASVERWQTLTESLYKDVLTLQLQGQNQSFSPSSSNGVFEDPKLKPPPSDAKLPHAQALLQAKSAELQTTAQTLEATNKVYGENAKLLAEQQSSLMDINATLARLTSDVISLEETKEILLQCIGLIVQLKARIVDLVDFFGMLSTVIKTVSTKLVAQWIETVKITVTGNADAGSASLIKVGQFSIESVERTMIMNGSLTIAAYFSFFADVAGSWREVSEKSIMPGIALAESLSIAEGDALSKKNKLDKWSKEAADNIKNICGKKRQEIQNGMAERVTKVRDMIKELPPPSSVVAEITQSVSLEIQAADKKVLEEETKNSPVTILSGRRRAM